jgi:hypothetical protein
VTAWAQWSADRRDLGEAGTTVLMDRVPQVLSRFGQAYDDPDAVAVRGYASGLAASDADIAWLSDQVGRRMFALPLPEQHAPLDLADAADRHRLVADDPPAGRDARPDSGLIACPMSSTRSGRSTGVTDGCFTPGR